MSMMKHVRKQLINNLMVNASSIGMDNMVTSSKCVSECDDVT